MEGQRAARTGIWINVWAVPHNHYRVLWDACVFPTLPPRIKSLVMTRRSSASSLLRKLGIHDLGPANRREPVLPRLRLESRLTLHLTRPIGPSAGAADPWVLVLLFLLFLCTRRRPAVAKAVP